MSQHSPPSSGTVVVAWTGHRKLKNEPEVKTAIGRVLDQLQATSSLGNRRFVGMGSIALGADTIIAEAMVAREIPISVILPFELERFERDEEATARQRIAALHIAAQSVRIVPCQASQDDAFLAAGEWMLDYADVLVAVVDPAQQDSGVGAHAIVSIAKHRGIMVVQVDAVTGGVVWPEVRPVSRQGSISDHDTEVSHRLLVSRADVENQHAALDASADKHSKSFRTALSLSIVLHLVAVGIAVIALLIEPKIQSPAVSWAAAVMKAGALIWALYLVWVNHGQHHGWLRSRAEAEICRSFLAIWNMPRQHLVLPPAPIEETRPAHREMSLAWLFSQPDITDFERVRRGYVGLHPSSTNDGSGRIGEQLQYFKRKGRPAKRLSGVVVPVASGLTFIAIVASLVVCWCLSVHSHGDWYMWSKGSSILLPLVSAAVLSWVTLSDRVRRAERYEQLANRLEDLWIRGDSARSWHELSRSVTDTELLLLAELGEWYAFARYAGALH